MMIYVGVGSGPTPAKCKAPTMYHQYHLRIAIVLFLLCIVVGYPQLSQAEGAGKQGGREKPIRETPSVMFIENVGQFGNGARFKSDAEIGTLFLADDALWLTILEPYEEETIDLLQKGQIEVPPRGGIHLRLTFVGANPHPTIEPFQPLTTSINYFIGNDSDKWYTHVPVWGGVRYVDLYPGIDLELSSKQGVPMQRLVVRDARRANLEQVVLKIEGSEGLQLSENGVLIGTRFGLYQLPFFEIVSDNGTALHLGKPTLTNNVIMNPMVQDTASSLGLSNNPLLPSSLVYASYLGGSDYDRANGVTVGHDGSIYVGGTTQSLDFPTTPGSYDPTPGGYPDAYEAFISKLNPSGTDLEYSTYIHGNDSDYIFGMVVDIQGEVYATGRTRSDDFPTTPNVPTSGFGGGADAFILKLSSDGSELKFSFCLGGGSSDFATDIDLASNGTVAVVGTTFSADFPVTLGAYIPDTPMDDHEIFVTRINAGGTEFIYSTRIGGYAQDDGLGIAVDQSGATYIVGRTASVGYPTTPDAFDPIPEIGNHVVTKFLPDGSNIVYSTAIDGDSSGSATADIEVDQTGAVYVTGEALSPEFPATPGAYDTECGEAGVGCGTPQWHGDGILFKLDPTGSMMVYGTYLGGEGEDYGNKVSIDSFGNAYVIGLMRTTNYMITPGGYVSPSSNNFAIWKISSDGSNLLHLSRVPGGAALAMTIQAPDVAIYAGAVFDYYETTLGAYDTTPNGDADVGTGRLLLPAIATTTTLSVSGGTLLSPVDSTTYSFSPNTFTETVVFTHAPRHPLSLPPIAPNVTVGHTFVNYAIGTDGTSPLAPLRPYTLDIAYDPGTIGVHERTLKLYYWNGSAWQIEPTAKLDLNANHLTAAPNRVGWWMVAGDPRPQYLPMVTRTP